MSRLFGHGDLRLYLLHLLDDRPRHGYELIVELEGRFLGLYSPSPGTIYPRLAALEEEGLVESTETDGRKVYRLTDAGRRELAAREAELREIGQRVASAARSAATEIRDDVRGAVRELRQEIMRAGREVRAEERRAAREVRAAKGDVLRSAERVRSDIQSDLRALQRDLQAFVSDVVGAAKRHRLDRDRLRELRDVLVQAKSSVIEVLEPSRAGTAGADADDPAARGGAT